MLYAPAAVLALFSSSSRQALQQLVHTQCMSTQCNLLDHQQQAFCSQQNWGSGLMYSLSSSC